MFGRDLEKLYGDRILTYYMHQISEHLADYVEKWGTLWANWAFGFESYNCFLARFIHGTKNVGKELVTNIRVHEGYTVLKNKFRQPISIEELDFSFEMLGRPTDLRSNSKLLSEIQLDRLRSMETVSNTCSSTLIYKRVEINGISYTSKLHKELKTDTSYVDIQLKKNPRHIYGVILLYVNKGDADFILLKKLKIKHGEMIRHDATGAVVEHILPFEESEDDIFINKEEIREINPVTRVKNYICKMPNHLRKIL
ncbi:hypothetical protein QAD02_003581 [Eretmocerus hayati]|uniref:Uncharacterized protein n=1 Tax=Eretmocerus hayati TaxID=131215 RepID=A0ACC2NML0_9HYME|nr:hypothetical protein QAD02_003581 [Eretmocerus hayati]